MNVLSRLFFTKTITGHILSKSESSYLMVLLRESALKSECKILEKHQRKSSFHSKVVGWRSATLLKMNSFGGIFKYFNCRSTKLLLRKPFFFINSYFLRIPSVAACFLKTLYCNCGRRNLGDVKIEFAKLRAFRAYVPSCLKLLSLLNYVPFVPTY